MKLEIDLTEGKDSDPDGSGLCEELEQISLMIPSDQWNGGSFCDASEAFVRWICVQMFGLRYEIFPIRSQVLPAVREASTS